VKREYWRYIGVVLPYLGGHKRLVSASFFLMLISAVFALADPLPLALLIDDVLGKNQPPTFISQYFGTDRSTLIAVAVGAGFLVILVNHLLAVLSEYVNTRLDQTVALDFRSHLFGHCQELSQAFHDETSTGDFMYRINYEAKAVGQLCVAIPPLIQSFLTLAGMLWVALHIDRTLALLSLTVVPFIYYSTEFYGNRIEPRLVKVRGLESLSLTMVNEAMAMLRVVVAFNRQRYEHRLFRAQGQTAVKARVRITVMQTVFSLVVSCVTAAGVALVLGVGAHDVLNGRITAGELLVILYYIQSIYKPLETISHTMGSFQEMLIGIRYAKQLLDTAPEVKDRPGARSIGAARGHLQFVRVSFAYRGRADALKSLTFEIMPGQVAAIVGPTGAGKSTLVSMVPRFIDPREGQILLDGVDLRDITLSSLRDQVAFVQQEPLLFSRSILDNIRYGRLDATDDEVIEAARAANAHDFIARLPGGYETRLGERGSRISGGERQRIAVARAFLKDAPILVLDEPTSSIDSRTEAVILDALDRLMEGRTTLIVAHRLSTVRSAHRIIVLSDGEIAEQGTHDELLAGRELYAQLHDLQSGVRTTARERTLTGRPSGGMR
jgi:ATP-binding cassette subfamily B protein